MGNAPLAATLAEIRPWHLSDGGWRNIGNYWLIDFDGERAAGLGETRIGADVEDHNCCTFGIFLIGGLKAVSGDTFANYFTLARARPLRTNITEILTQTAITKARGHTTCAAKAYPRSRVAGWIQVSQRSAGSDCKPTLQPGGEVGHSSCGLR